MKVTFIRPGMNSRKSSDALQPLVFAILAGLIPPGIETVLYDDRIEEILFDEPADLVAMTVGTFSAKRAYHIAAQYRQRGIPVVMGGFHPTILPQEVLQHAESVVIGDAETVWPQVLSDARKGDLQRVYRANPKTATLDISLNRRIFAGKAYPPIHLIQWGRGCPQHCDFCAVHTFYEQHMYFRPIDAVISEIGELQSKYFAFVDDNLFVNKPRLTRLLEALESLNVRWLCQISLNVAQDAQLMTLLEKSGCEAVMIGFESLEPDNLRQMKKQCNLAEQGYERILDIFYDHGMMVYGSFLFGYNHDTPDSFKRCLDFAFRRKLFLANFNPLTPYPGTALYSRLKKENRLICDPWWLDDTYQYGHATFHPQNMTSDELTQGCFWIRKQFNSYTSILQRAFKFRVNLQTWRHAALYFAANYINRKEIHKKQGASLGVDCP